MYLVSIHIENLRAIRQLSLNFLGQDADETPRRWTVLLGENGCGKSTILKAIGLALAGSVALPDLLGDPSDWVRNGAARATIKLTVRTAEREDRTFTLVIVRGDGIDTVIKRNSEGLAQLDSALKHGTLNYFVAGYGAFRRPPDPEQEQVWSRRHRQRAAALNTLFTGNAGLIGMEQWARQHDYRAGPDGRHIIGEALNMLLPGMTFKEIDKETGQLVLETQDGAVALRHLSEGYQAMAAWAGDLLYRMSEAFASYKNPLTARGVLLVDEMDLHLHPVWKRRLVEFINDAFPNLQVVATTHSPLSIQQCGENELYVVMRDKELGPLLIAFKGDPSNMRLSELFLSPLVGLESLDSPRIAELKSVARAIELRPGEPSEGEAAALQEIAQHLVGASPMAHEEAPGFEQYMAQMAELRKIDPLVRMANSAALFGGTAAGRQAAPTVRAKKPLKKVAKDAAKSSKRKTATASNSKMAVKRSISAKKKVAVVKKATAERAGSAQKRPAKRVAKKSAKRDA